MKNMSVELSWRNGRKRKGLRLLGFLNKKAWKEARSKMQRKGFTLIELMVVIAIIIILAAIAIPNYINMTHRAQVTRATSDLAVIETALECYKTDVGGYPAVTCDILDARMGLAATNSSSNWGGPYTSGVTLTAIKGTEVSVLYAGNANTYTITIYTLDGQTVTRGIDGKIVVSQG